jgi:hypothetical protein
VNQQLAPDRHKDEATIHTEEIIIVFIIIVIWMSFILLFIKKWGRIRTLEPQYFLPKELLQAVAAPDLLVPSAVAAVTASGPAAANQSLMNATAGSAAAGSRVNNSGAIIYNNINNSSHKQNNNLSPASTASLPTATCANRSQRMANNCSSSSDGQERTNSTQSLGRTTTAIEAQVKRNSGSSESITNNPDRSWSEKNEKGGQIVTSGRRRGGTRSIQMNAGKEQLIDRRLSHDAGSGSDLYDLLNDGKDRSLIKSEDDGRELQRNLLKVNSTTKVWRGTSCRDWQQYCDVPSDGDHLSAGRKVFRPNHEKVDFHAESDGQKARDAIRDESVDHSDRRADDEEQDDGKGGKVGKEKILQVDRMFRSADDLMGTLLHQDRRCSLLSTSIQRTRHFKKETHHPVSSSASIDVKQAADKEREM